MYSRQILHLMSSMSIHGLHLLVNDFVVSMVEEEEGEDGRVVSLAAVGITLPSLNPLITVSFSNAFLGKGMSGTPDVESKVVWDMLVDNDTQEIKKREDGLHCFPPKRISFASTADSPLAREKLCNWPHYQS